MKDLIYLSVIFILGVCIYTQTTAINDLFQSNLTLANHIKENNQARILEAKLTAEIQKSRIHPAIASYYAKIYVRAAKEYKVDPLLLVRMGAVESRFRWNAVSYAGAIGLQQIMPKYWANGEISFIKRPGDLFDSEKNIYASAHILSYYIRTAGGIMEGIRSYHGGFRAIDRPRAVTIQYQRDVLKGYQI